MSPSSGFVSGRTAARGGFRLKRHCAAPLSRMMRRKPRRKSNLPRPGARAAEMALALLDSRNMSGVYSSSQPRLIVIGPPFTRVPGADRAASLGLLLALLPVIVCIAIAIRLSSAGPVFVGAPCLDARGRRCLLWSFRTRRTARLGRLLRVHGLDRLPVLFSVVHGTVTLREALSLEPIQ
jgi:hypothetical protein